MFKLSMQIDVSLSDFLLGLAGCSVAICAYKYSSTKKDEHTENLKSEVIKTSEQNHTISAKSDDKGHDPSILISKEVVVSSKEPSLDENKQKFKSSKANNVNNFEESDAANLMSSEVTDTDSDDSSISIVHDKDKETNSSTPEEKQCFLQTDIPEISPSIAKQTGLSQSNVEDCAVPSLNMKEDVPASVNSSAEDSATDSTYIKSSVDENKVNSEPFKVDNTIEKNSVISLGKTTDTSEVSNFDSKESSENIKSYSKKPLTHETGCSAIQSKQTFAKSEDTTATIPSVTKQSSFVKRSNFSKENQTSTNEDSFENSLICSTIRRRISNTTIVQNENIIQESNQKEKMPKYEIKYSENKEKVDVGEKLKQYKLKFKNMGTLIRCLRKKLVKSVEELSTEENSFESLTSLIKRKDQQFKDGSNNKFIIKLRQIEVKYWYDLKEDLQYTTDCNLLAFLINDAFSEVIQFYDNLIDLLEKLVLLCADPSKRLQIKNKKLAEIELNRNAVDRILSKISRTNSESAMARLVNEVKSEIEKFFEPDISDIKSLLDLL